MSADILQVRLLDNQAYLDCWQAMKDFTHHRLTDTPDEIWLVEHPPVYTQGQNGKPEHFLNPFSAIPLIETDRGGQITYHGPGQLMCYTLVDLKRKKINIREFVTILEQSVIELLSTYKIEAFNKCKAPGIYVKVNATEKKIASLGLRVKRGCTYHGIALNIHMNLKPFEDINPCGFTALQMTQLFDFTDESFKKELNLSMIGKKLVAHLSKHLDYLQVYYD